MSRALAEPVATAAAPPGHSPIADIAAQDVVIAGYPKSGHTWFQCLAAGVCYGVDPERAPDALIQDLVPDVHFKRSYRRYRTPMLFKSHHLPRPEYRRVVYLLRDGRDAMVSYYHHLSALAGREIDFLAMVRDGEGLFPGKWHEHVEAWRANPYGAEMLTIRYEDLRRDTVGQLRRFCAFVGIPWAEPDLATLAEKASFDRMRRREAEQGWENPWPHGKFFVRRGAIGSHRDEMPAAVLAAFLEDAGTTLKACGYLEPASPAIADPGRRAGAKPGAVAPPFAGRGAAKRFGYALLRAGEALAFGTGLRERLLSAMLRRHHLSVFRRQWKWAAEFPHFEDHRCFLHLWGLPGDRPWPLGGNPDFLARGLFNRELLRPGCRVLDLCCGDGFFDRHFYSGAAGRVDAVDHDPRPLRLARRRHAAPNVAYHRADLLTDPFPAPPYDFVFWDGAIGHFTDEQIARAMEKIRAALAPGGVLAGSEALEAEDRKSWDHPVAFPEPEALRDLLRRFFPCVTVKEIPPIRGRYRECYFRCGSDPGAIRGAAWRP